MEIKDQATAIEAALNLDKPGSEPAPKPGEPATPRKLSTSAKLFPEFTTVDGGIINRPIKPFEDSTKALPPVAATPATAPAPAAPAPAPTVAPILDLSKLDPNTMVRMKVDGVEMDVPASVATKNLQLERHLNLQSQKLAQERATLEAERAALRQPPPVTAPGAPAPATPPKTPPATPSPEAAKIAQLEADIAAMRAIVAPQQFQAGLQRLAERAKTELGATDFLDYAPKIQAFVDGELAKPEVQSNPAALASLDNANFWYAKYQELKLKDVLSGKTPAAPNLTRANVVPVAEPVVEPIVAPAGTSVVLDRNNRPVVVPVVEGANGVPSRTSPDEQWQARYQAAFATAKKTGRTEDWQEVFRLKREVPA